MDAVIAGDGDAVDVSAQRRVAEALLSKSAALEKMGRTEEGLAALDAVVERFAESEHEELRHDAVRALHAKGHSYLSAGRPEQADAAFAHAAALGDEFAHPSREAALAA